MLQALCRAKSRSEKRESSKRSSNLKSSDSNLVRGFDIICLHEGYTPDSTTSLGVPLYRTAPNVFKDTETAANLFALKELGKIYTRLVNP